MPALQRVDSGIVTGVGNEVVRILKTTSVLFLLWIRGILFLLLLFLAADSWCTVSADGKNYVIKNCNFLYQEFQQMHV